MYQCLLKDIIERIETCVMAQSELEQSLDKYTDAAKKSRDAEIAAREARVEQLKKVLEVKT